MSRKSVGLGYPAKNNTVSRHEITIILGLVAAILIKQFFPIVEDAEQRVPLRILLDAGAIGLLFSTPALRAALRPMLRWPIDPFEPPGMVIVRTVILATLAFFAFYLGRYGSYAVPESWAGLIPVEGEHTFEIAKTQPLRGVTRYLLMPLAAVQEELLFRAGVFVVLRRLGLGSAAIVLISAPVFGAVHLSSGLPVAAFTTLAGAGMMVIFLRRRSLPPLVIGHYAFNLWGAP